MVHCEYFHYKNENNNIIFMASCETSPIKNEKIIFHNKIIDRAS